MPKKVATRTTSGKTKQQPSKLNPALKSIEVLVGDWDLEMSNVSFLPSPSDTARIRTSFERLEDGAFLIMREEGAPPGAPVASWVIGRDDAVQDYSILHYDSRGVSRRYEMSFNDGVWKIWRKAPGFWQRFEGKVSDDANTITAHWEKSADDKNWEHDFDLKYTRLA